MNLAPGSKIGRWTIQHELGRGGMGTVYRVTSPLVPGNDRAMKIINEPRSTSAEYRAMLRDTDYCSSLMRVLDVIGPEGGAPENTIALLFRRGDLSLDALLDERGPLSEWETADVVYSLTQALAALHAPDESGQVVVHNDVKPHNLVWEGAEWQLTDFGVSSIDQDGRPSLAGGFTVRYAAPELVRSGYATPATDVWSVGCVAAECLGLTIDAATASASAEHDELSSSARSLVGRCFRADPRDRPSVWEIHGELRRWRRPPDAELAHWFVCHQDVLTRGAHGVHGLELAREVDRIVGADRRPAELRRAVASLRSAHPDVARLVEEAAENMRWLIDLWALRPARLSRGLEAGSWDL